MNDEPADLPCERVADLLRRHWGVAPGQVEYAPVGFGPDDPEVLAAYQRAAGPVVPRPAAMELFELWWALAEVCGYVQLFRQPHADTTDTTESWRNLQHYARAGVA